jgi:hypothetical protein
MPAERSIDAPPAEEAIQFHHALLENAVHSVLVSYPGKGHGARNIPWNLMTLYPCDSM